MEITRVNEFIATVLEEIDQKLVGIRANVTELLSTKTKKAKGGDDDEPSGQEKIVDRMIREVYEECNEIASFLELNLFAIAKTAKKFRKLCPSPTSVRQVPNSTTEKPTDVWSTYKSFESYQNTLTKSVEIKELTKRCEDLYCTAFRSTYPELAHAELHFDKDKHQQRKKERIALGMKFGIIVTLVAFLVVISTNKRANSVVFLNPAIFVYTTIGNILLFRLLWACNVWLWKENHINYNHLLALNISQPNPYALLEETSTFFMLYCINFIIFLELGVDNFGRVTNNVWPLVLLGITLAFMAKTYVSFIWNRKKQQTVESEGTLFDYGVWRRCLSTPLVPVTYRDNFAADVLTSFTKPMSDGVLGMCWLVSGAFLKQDQSIKDFGSDYLQCNGTLIAELAHVYIVAIPFLIRFLQCVRDMTDKRTIHPQFTNAMKYLSAIVVIAYGVTGDKTSGVYYFLVIFASLYKWIWDVIMDWDLFYVRGMFPTHWVFLRKDLLYYPPLIYYIAIVADLVLRFVWVMSLAPTDTPIAILNTSQFNFFFGSLEIIRRFMWGHFRMEYEHLKHIRKNEIGYIERRRNSTVLKSNTAKTGKKLLHRTRSILENGGGGPGGGQIPALAWPPSLEVPTEENGGSGGSSERQTDENNPGGTDRPDSGRVLYSAHPNTGGGGFLSRILSPSGSKLVPVDDCEEKYGGTYADTVKPFEQV